MSQETINAIFALGGVVIGFVLVVGAIELRDYLQRRKWR